MPNTFVLFRRELDLADTPGSALGWLTADSRYKLTVNGQRVQWGPAPCDPRWPEVDPCDMTGLLRPGKNVIGVEVCYFGHGDGTWPMGAPGFIFKLEVDGQMVVSDHSWQTFLDRSHRPGMYKRWFLRALQEEFDARKHPYGWDTSGFQPGPNWLPAMELSGSASTPAIFAGGPEYALVPDNPTQHDAADYSTSGPQAELRARTIPLMSESLVDAAPMADCGRVTWLRDPDDWFESRIPGSFTTARDPRVTTAAPSADEGFFFTFNIPEQVVGFPRFTIEAPAGTIVELMVREAHDPDTGPLWLDNYIFHWTRFICREGVNEFETFDYESVRWIQLHVRNTSRPVTIRHVGVRRRAFPWPNEPRIRCEEPALQRLFDASVNTLRNSCLETAVDGMGRERQQYSGDGGHQLQSVRPVFGDTQLSARFMKTFSQGMTLDGYFMDCWPAFDRLGRLMQRQVGTTAWGPLLDHGVGFNFDCWQHYLDTGDLETLDEAYPRLRRFAEYLGGLRRDDGLLPVEDIGVPTVWLDHHAYREQAHKRCAFNLYVAAAFQRAMAPIAEAFGDDPLPYRQLGAEIQAATVDRYWQADRQLFIIGDDRTCDRSLATAVLFDQCPDGATRRAVETLAECPSTMGLSYPCNAVWRYWALAKGGRTDVIVRELREKWATMNSVLHNNTLQENWTTSLNSGDQFSHCPLAPLIMLYQCLAGIRPTAPGFSKLEIRPQLADIGDLDLLAYTPRGPIAFTATRTASGHDVAIRLTDNCEATLVIPGAQPQVIAAEFSFHVNEPQQVSP